MGIWDWWSSSTNTPDPNARETNTPTLSQHQQSQSSRDPSLQPERPNPPQRSSPFWSSKAKADALDREDAAIEELRTWFDKNNPETTPSKAQPPLPQLQDQSTTAQSAPPPVVNDDEEQPDSSLYPDTLSCTQCFDAAFYCNSIGGQLTNVYRYGGLRSCSELWAQWRFCMRTKTMNEAEKRRRVREWNRDKEVRRRLKKNSEEVWALRGREDEGTSAGADGWEVHMPAFVPGGKGQGEEAWTEAGVRGGNKGVGGEGGS